MSARTIRGSELCTAQSSAVEPSRAGSLTLTRLAISVRTASKSPSLAAMTSTGSPFDAQRTAANIVTNNSIEISSHRVDRLGVAIFALPLITQKSARSYNVLQKFTVTADSNSSVRI